MGIQHSIKNNRRILVDLPVLSIESIVFKHLLGTNELIFYINMSSTKKQEDFYCCKYDLYSEDNKFTQAFALFNSQIENVIPCHQPYTDMFLLKDDHSLQIYKSYLAQSSFKLEGSFDDMTQYHQLQWTLNDEGIIGSTYDGSIKYFDIISRKIMQLYDESSEKKTNANNNTPQGFYDLELIDYDIYKKSICFSSMSGGVYLYDYDNATKIAKIAPDIHADNLTFNPSNYLLCFNEYNSGRSYLYDLRKTNNEVGRFCLKEGTILQQEWSSNDM